MMENITDEISDMQKWCTYLDYLKSEYLLIAQDLKITIIDSEDSMTPESEEEIQFYINQLISFKEKLLLELDRFADKIKLLNDELEGGERDDAFCH